jgi:peptidoglycan/LPS O-acetylase OafA/YrhL
MRSRAKNTTAADSKTWFVNLDATRFLGFFHVFLAHCFITDNHDLKQSAIFQFITTHLKSGFLGLDYFFVLSAFLLTWLALEEIHSRGNFNPVKFLIRRGLRLWPLYFMLILGVYTFAELITGIEPLPPLKIFLLFYANLWMAEHDQHFLFMLVFFWSVSVEEQFYLLWAMFIRISEKLIPLICLLMIFTSLIFRFLHFEQNNMLSFHTLSILGNFGAGGLAAWLSFKYPSVQKTIKALPRFIIAGIYLLLVFFTVFYFRLFNGLIGVSTEKLIFAFLFSLIILEQCFSDHSLFKFGRFPVFNYLGKISLGLYCYHGLALTLAGKWLPAAGMATRPLQVYLINPLIIFASTLIMAVISYELFEKKLHRLRRHFY